MYSMVPSSLHSRRQIKISIGKYEYIFEIQMYATIIWHDWPFGKNSLGISQCITMVIFQMENFFQ